MKKTIKPRKTPQQARSRQTREDIPLPVYRPRHHSSVHCGAIIGVKGKHMRSSVTLDDDLLRTAHEYTGITERAELLREALKSIIAREAGRRLLALAGTVRISKMCVGGEWMNHDPR